MPFRKPTQFVRRLSSLKGTRRPSLIREADFARRIISCMNVGLSIIFERAYEPEIHRPKSSGRFERSIDGPSRNEGRRPDRLEPAGHEQCPLAAPPYLQGRAVGPDGQRHASYAARDRTCRTCKTSFASA